MAYTTLVNDYRAAAHSLAVIAGRMFGYRDLPMAVHDESKMTSPAAQKSFATFVESERALLELMKPSVQRDEEMLAQMR